MTTYSLPPAGAGNDHLILDRRGLPGIDVADPAFAGLFGFERMTVLGSDQDDHVRGTAGNDTLQGGLGNDVLEGRCGDDLLGGSGGDDLLIASPTGFSTAYGGAGNDPFIGFSEYLTVSGGTGFDVVSITSPGSPLFGPDLPRPVENSRALERA